MNTQDILDLSAEEIGSLLSIIGEVADQTFGTHHGAVVFGVAGFLAEGYVRSEDGFTTGDALSMGAGWSAGVAAGSATTLATLNPLAGIVVGTAVGVGTSSLIDGVPEEFYFDESHRPAGVLFRSGSSIVVEKSYLIGTKANGVGVLQTERTTYSSEGEFLSQARFRTEVVGGGETLDLIRASAQRLTAAGNPGLDVGGLNSSNVNKCFPAGTPIALLGGSSAPIEAVQVGDTVAAFDAGAAGGRDALEGRRVVRLFENITDTWIKLSNGLTVTPGHRFLTADGGFAAIEDILQTDGQIVLEDGSLATVTGQYIRYSAETAHLYEQAEGYVTASVGGLALAPVYKKGWKTYNFEVEGLHTWRAASVCTTNPMISFPNIQVRCSIPSRSAATIRIPTAGARPWSGVRRTTTRLWRRSWRREGWG